MPMTGKRNDRKQQIHRGNKKPAKIATLRPHVEIIDKRYNDLAKFPLENPYPVLRIHKDGTLLYANKASESFLKAKDTAVGKPAPTEWRRLVKNALSSGQVIREENTLNERVFSLRAVPIAESNYVNFYGTDITEQKLAEEEREIAIKLLSLINSRNQTHELMKLATTLLRDWSGCEAVGIRLQDGKDFPYFETNGFPDKFVQAESKLCSLNELGEPLRDSHGRVYLECMCGNIIRSRFNSFMPFFTKHGSFWTNCSSEFDANTTEAERLTKTRNRCVTAGYESLALIPLRAGKETFGLLQFNSKQKNKFTPEKISLLEHLADNLAVGLAQRKAEESLRESEAKYRAVIETTDTGFVALDEKGHVLNANLNYAQMIGYSSVDKIIGRQVMEWTAPYDLERNRIEVSKCFNNGSVRNLQIDYRRADGTIVPIEINANVVQTKNGRIIVTLCRNITERKRAEEQIQMLKHSIDIHFDGAYWFDSNNKLVYVNDAGCQALGYQYEELLGKTLSKVNPKATEKGLREVWEQLRRKGSFTTESVHRRKDGSEFPVEISSTYVQFGGKEYNCGFARDITERKQTEQKILDYQKRLKQLASRLTLIEEQERRQIAGEIHDEISQTLAMAKIKLDTLRSSPPSEWSSAEIKQISSSIEKVIQETRTLTFELSNPILYELGFEAAAAEWLNEQVRVKYGIDTDFFDDGKAKPLNDDLKVMLFRNVRELLTNCIKHAKAEKISVSIHRVDGSIQVIVEDNGAGFDPARLRTTADKKLTFGLFSIRESMENTGGSFEIESKPGAGCKAVMTAPLKSSVKNKEI